MYGKNRRDHENEKASNKPKKVSKIKSRPLTTKAIREQEVKAELKILKEQIHVENINNNTYYCRGCGLNGHSQHLDCSHILSVKQRKEMELVKDNIQLLCRTCHMDWESWNFKKMNKLNCFKSNLEFLKEHDQYRFNRLTLLIETAE